MATFVFFDEFFLELGKGTHDLSSDTLKIALSNTAPTMADNTLSDITQITAANGYTSGGTALTTVTFTEAAGTCSLKADNVVFTASGGAIATFQYAILYNDTASNDELIGYWDAGTTIDLADTETCTVTYVSRTVFSFTKPE